MCSTISSIGHNSDLDFSTCSSHSNHGSPMSTHSLTYSHSRADGNSTPPSSAATGGSSPHARLLASTSQTRNDTGTSTTETPIKAPSTSLGVIPEEGGSSTHGHPATPFTPATALASRLNILHMSQSGEKWSPMHPIVANTPDLATSSSEKRKKRKTSEQERSFRDAWEQQDVEKCDAFFQRHFNHSDHVRMRYALRVKNSYFGI